MSEREDIWVVSTSPHAHSGDSVRKIMLAVIVALLPALAAALWLFCWDTVRLVSACVASCVVAEAVSRKLMRRDTGIADLSAVVTGLLLAFNLPPSLPLWMAVLGSVFAIVIAKQVFGGIGYNPFNPALAGRVFLFFCFPAAMTTWHAPGAGCSADAVTAATPLGMWKTAWSNGAAPSGFFELFPLRNLFLGAQAGCIGEVSAFALLLGGAYLLWRRCIYWQTPMFYLGTVAAFSGLLWLLDPARNLSPLYHLLSGGLMLGAFFMATDMVTSPVTKRGMAVFGVGCGLLTVVIRKWGGPPEGVSFSILLMNAVTPLINRCTKSRVFGHKKEGGA